MKKTFIMLLAAAALGISGAVIPDPPHMPKRLPRVKSIGSKTVLTLTKSNTAIVIAPEAPATTRHAAQEMADLLGKVLGGKLKVFRAPQPGMVNIYLGFNAWSKKAGIDPATHHRDSFTMKINKDGVFIAGADDPKVNPQRNLKGGIWGNLYERATVFGVYDFLERFAGARFYFPGDLGTILPAANALKLPETTLFDYPDFINRKVSYYQGAWPGKPASYVERNEKNLATHRYRLETFYIPSCHGLSRLGYIYRFGKSNPEYFASNSQGKSVLQFRNEHTNQLCFNSGIRQEIYKDALSFLKGEPATVRGIRPYHRTDPKRIAWHSQLDLRIPVYDITPDDGYYPCRCPKCSKSFPDITGRSNKALSDFMWRYYADAANYVKGYGYIAAWIYYPTLLTPDFKLPDNILFVMCPKGPWSCGNETVYKKEMEKVKTWGKITGNRMRLWNYMIKYPHGSYPGVPSNAPRAVARYYRDAAPYICGAFAEVGMERFMFQYLNLYVYYKALWDKIGRASCRERV